MKSIMKGTIMVGVRIMLVRRSDKRIVYPQELNTYFAENKEQHVLFVSF